MHSAWFRSTFLRVLKFLQIKDGGPNFWGEPILQKVWIIWSPLLYLNFKSFVDSNSSSFIRFQCILHSSGVVFLESSNFYKLKSGDLISGGNQFCRKSKLFGPPFCILILNFLWTQIHCHSSDLNVLSSLRSTFLRVLKFLQVKEARRNFWGEPILQKVWIIWSPLLYFIFKSFMDTNFLSLVRFQWILYDSVVIFSESWNFYKLKRGDLISRGNQFCSNLNYLVPPSVFQF